MYNKYSPLKQYKTVWVSDVHLGSRFSKAEIFLDFLNSIQAEQIILVGDIIDIWSLKSNWYWNQKHSDVILKLLSLANSGTIVKYIPGNHDEIFRDYIGESFGNIKIYRNLEHLTADGKKLLITHGDEYDVFMKDSYRLVMNIGDYIHQFIQQANRLNLWLRRVFKRDYWSLASYLKTATRDVIKLVNRFEKAVSNSIKITGYDGVICGHIHQANKKQFDETIYLNTGDWVDSCTGLVENYDGTIEVIHWTDEIMLRDNFHDHFYEKEYHINGNVVHTQN